MDRCITAKKNALFFMEISTKGRNKFLKKSLGPINNPVGFDFYQQKTIILM